MLTAKDIMTPNAVTIGPDASIKDLSDMFIKHNVNGIPVVDEDGTLLGVVTEGDLIEQNKHLHIPTVISLFDAVIYLESDKKFKDEVKKLSATRVADIYTPDPVTVSPGTPINDCGAIMAEKDIHTLPVLENGRLAGVIGKLDVIKGMTRS